MSGPSNLYDDPYEHHYDDYHARQEDSAHFYQDNSYVQEGYYPQDSISKYDFKRMCHGVEGDNGTNIRM